MAEYYSTRHIAQQMREFVKTESRRIRLAGVRAKVCVFSFDLSPDLTALKAFSWADITVVIKKLSGDQSLCAQEIEKAAQDSTIHGIIIAGNSSANINKQQLYNIIPTQKDIFCCSASSIAALLCGDTYAFLPPFSESVLQMFSRNDVAFVGKHIVIFGSCNTSRALAFTLMNLGCNVSLCAQASSTAIHIAERADILISKLDMPESINAAFMNEKQVIIDLGRNTGANGKITGDVVFRDAEKFVHGIFIGQETCFFELNDYIACSYILKTAAQSIVK